MAKAKKAPISRAETEEFYFDEAAAGRAVEFFEKYLRHTKGRWAGKAFKLEEWQKERLIRPLFGWKRADGTRRYRNAYIEIPKKNGKSALCSGIALYMTFADGEEGAEVYSAAADKDQAAIVFNVAKDNVVGSPELLRRALVQKNAIYYEARGAVYRVLSSDAPTKHGLNPSGIIFDELHAQPNRELWDTLTTGTGARRQPLTVTITTAGYDRHSICWEMHEYASKVIAGTIKDESFLAVIYAADEADDWTKRETWYKANPNLGITISEEFMRTECARAQERPAYENTFKRLFLNIWTSQDTRWMPMAAWNESAGEVDPLELRGRQCWAGLDLSSSVDITALVLLFREGDTFKALPYFWIPKENIEQRVKRDHVPYDVWVRQGLIYATEGNVIDYKSIIAKMVEMRTAGFDMREVAYDRWGATKLVQDLQEEDFNVVPFGQGFGSMSGPTKELLNLVLSKRFHHGGHPVLRWMADNVTVLQDPAGNIKPNKAKSREKIDGIVASIMALARATCKDAAGPSVYSERGIRTL